MECPICGSRLTGAEHDERTTSAVLFGLSDDPYAVCPNCYDATDHDTYHDEAFRQRLRRFYLSRGIVLQQNASGRWVKRSI